MSSFVFIGDSQGVRLEPHLEALFVRRGFTLIGSAVHAGWSTASFLASDEIEPLARARPDLVLVALGGNDVPDHRLAGRIARLVAPFRSRSAYIVWIGPAHTTKDWLAVRKAGVIEIQRAVAAELGFEWFDGWSMTADLEHTADGVHFTAGAAERWARRIDSAVFARGRSTGWTWAGVAGIGALFGWLIWMAR